MTRIKGVPATRDRILEAALRLFSQKGYLGATTKEIAMEAGIAEVTLFRHFQSKEDLFENVITTYSFLPTLKDLLPEVEGMLYEDALRVIAKRFLETLSSRKDLIQIMHSEMHRYPEKIHMIHNTIIDNVIKTLASYFEELKAKGLLSDFNSELGATAFLGMFFSFFNAQELIMRKRYNDNDTEHVVSEYVNIFVNGTLKAGQKGGIL